MNTARKNNIRKLSFLGFNRDSDLNDSSHGGNIPEVRLDDEMDKVFSMSGTVSDERFDVAKLHADTPESTNLPRHFNEKDYSLHRKKSYPHMHLPLKALHSSRSMRRRVTSPHISENDPPDYASIEENSRADSEKGQISAATAAEDEETGTLSSESENPISDPAAGLESPIFGSPDKRVQFTIGAIPNIPEDESATEVENQKDPERKDKIRRKSRHHYGHNSRFRKYSLQEDPGWRKRSGTELEGLTVNSRGPSRRVSIQPEDATLEEVDIDDLMSHRSDDPRAFRRKKSSRSGSFVHISRKEDKLLHNVLSPLALKKMYDHSPHAVFVQLDELTGTGEEREWRETARWIKYEEDVEEGSDRWGRPHVASLSFHSLLNLRRCLETGVVLLDLEEKDLPGVAYRVSEQMVIDELIQEADKSVVMRALLLRHRHVNEHVDGFAKRFVKRHNSSYSSLQNLNADRKASYVALEALTRNGSANTDVEGKLIVPDNHTIIDMKEETYTSSTEDLKKAKDEAILKRIPLGAEATTVLVGAVDFLEQPTIAFVRLAEGVLMPSITEVTIPVRFLFILLGPIMAELDYHEVGRSISTLMANHQFHKIAYKAEDRKILLSAINEFLDDSIVLPPGDWERQNLLQFDELKAKSNAIRKRKLKALSEKGIAPIGDESKSLLLGDAGDGKKPAYPDPLKRTRRPFGGLINDLKRRYPLFKSDLIDGLNPQCFAAAIFMYFAALSGAITFGGLMSDKTQNLIGISETLVATSFAGVIFAVLAGQPLVIVGSTGPLLLFDESLYQFCKANNLEYLTIRVYIGIWLGIIALIVACLEGSVFVKLFTRFTEEIFSALISLLYIVESVMKLYFVYGQHPLLADYCGNSTLPSVISNESSTELYNDINDNMLMDDPFTNNTELNITEYRTTFAPPVITDTEIVPLTQPNTALFCTILALGTFAIAYYLRLFRNSKFLGRNARRALGDFGVPIAIVIMVALDYFIPQTYTEKLRVPNGLTPSHSERGWFISPAGTDQPVEVWVIFAAGIPAMLVYILVFMETHISELIIDKKERKLKKGSGFHLDIVLVCLTNVGCGFLGTPWICAATVRSVAHVSAVTVMSRTHAPGEKPHLIEVKEQRVSGLTVALLVGLSVLMSPLLRLVPMSVLFGVFLYMGISSMDGIQFFERIKLFFMPVKHHPNTSYVKRVQTYKMHLFTVIQLLCLVILWIVKSTRASLAFPFFLLLMVPLRAQLAHLFSQQELRALDGDQPDVEDEEPDFYVEAPLPG